MGLWDYALTTVADAKIFLRIDASNSDYDALLEDLINAVSKACERICKSDLKKRDSITEYHNGDGTSMLFLDHLPVISVTSLHDDTNRDYASDTLIAADDYVIHSDEGIIELVDDVFAVGVHNVRGIYVAGYATVPEDLALACKKWVAHIFKEIEDGRTGLETRSGVGSSTKFVVDEPPKAVRMLLHQFGRVSV